MDPVSRPALSAVACSGVVGLGDSTPARVRLPFVFVRDSRWFVVRLRHGSHARGRGPRMARRRGRGRRGSRRRRSARADRCRLLRRARKRQTSPRELLSGIDPPASDITRVCRVRADRAVVASLGEAPCSGCDRREGSRSGLVGGERRFISIRPGIDRKRRSLGTGSRRLGARPRPLAALLRIPAGAGLSRCRRPSKRLILCRHCDLYGRSARSRSACPDRQPGHSAETPTRSVWRCESSAGSGDPETRTIAD